MRVRHHLSEERRIIETQTLVQNTMRHVVIINQHIRNGMDISIQSLNVGILNLNTIAHNRLDAGRSHFRNTVCKRSIGNPTIEVSFSADTNDFHQGERQHGLVILYQRNLGNLVEAIQQLVVRSTELQDVIANEHIQTVVGIGIV